MPKLDTALSALGCTVDQLEVCQHSSVTLSSGWQAAAAAAAQAALEWHCRTRHTEHSIVRTRVPLLVCYSTRVSIRVLVLEYPVQWPAPENIWAKKVKIGALHCSKFALTSTGGGERAHCRRGGHGTNVGALSRALNDMLHLPRRHLPPVRNWLLRGPAPVRQPNQTNPSAPLLPHLLSRRAPRHGACDEEPRPPVPGSAR